MAASGGGRVPASKAVGRGRRLSRPALAALSRHGLACFGCDHRLTKGVAEHRIMNKPSRSFAKPLRDLVGKAMGDTFKKQGFASAELVTRSTKIVGADIAAHSQPIKIQWQIARPTARSANPAR